MFVYLNIALGYHEDLRTRTNFIEVLTFILKQVSVCYLRVSVCMIPCFLYRALNSIALQILL